MKPIFAEHSADCFDSRRRLADHNHELGLRAMPKVRRMHVEGAGPTSSGSGGGGPEAQLAVRRMDTETEFELNVRALCGGAGVSESSEQDETSGEESYTEGGEEEGSEADDIFASADGAPATTGAAAGDDADLIALHRVETLKELTELADAEAAVEDAPGGAAESGAKRERTPVPGGGARGRATDGASPSSRGLSAKAPGADGAESPVVDAKPVRRIDTMELLADLFDEDGVAGGSASQGAKRSRLQ